MIPDYQRPYAWGEMECQTLWDDIFAFAFPENDYSKFDSDNDEYFLGPIVENSISTRDDIARCIWKTDEFGKPDKNKSIMKEQSSAIEKLQRKH